MDDRTCTTRKVMGEKRAPATPTPKRAPIHVAKRNGAPLICSSVLLAVLEKTIGRNPFLVAFSYGIDHPLIFWPSVGNPT